MAAAEAAPLHGTRGLQEAFSEDVVFPAHGWELFPVFLPSFGLQIEK